MAGPEREFYRSFRGPGVGDDDAWRLVYDTGIRALHIRHSWRSERHSGTDEFSLEKFLMETCPAREALVFVLSEPTAVNA
jgi:hypothetical protein